MITDRIPYTYIIVDKETGKCYYGVRFAKGCDPSDLGKTYFTSSKRLRKRFKHNPSNFSYEIRRTFSSIESAQRWEHKVLRRLNAQFHSKMINAANGGPCDGQSGGVISGTKFSDEHRASMKGPKSPDHAAKLRVSTEKARAALSRPEVRAKMSASRKKNPPPNKGWRKLPLTKDFLLSTINMTAGEAAVKAGVSVNSIYKYRKEILGYTVIQRKYNGIRKLR